jgi:dTDP-glucose pyrophosphorylase
MTKESNWKKTLLLPDGFVKDAIRILSDSALRIVLVVDSNMKLLGTVTDGDIRRGLLRGISLESSILEVMNQRPLFTPPGVARELVLRLMRTQKVYQVPIIKEDLTLIGLHLWDEPHASIKRNNVMIIMAGGRGTRLLPKTENIPKPMILIGGRPILEHIICHAKEDGFTKFILSIHHLGEVIEEFFGDGKSFEVEISYVRETTPLGTAGALGLINPEPTEPIIVTNGDVLTKIRYGDILDYHIQNDAMATMAVQTFESQNPFGVVETSGIVITGYEEKPISRVMVNAGVYVLDPGTLKLLEKNSVCQMPLLFELIREKGLKTIAFPLHEKWFDLGSPGDLAKATEDYEFNREFGGRIK